MTSFLPPSVLKVVNEYYRAATLLKEAGFNGPQLRRVCEDMIDEYKAMDGTWEDAARRVIARQRDAGGG